MQFRRATRGRAQQIRQRPVRVHAGPRGVEEKHPFFHRAQDPILRPVAPCRLAVGLSTARRRLLDTPLCVSDSPADHAAVDRPHGERADDDPQDEQTRDLRHLARVYGREGAAGCPVHPPFRGQGVSSRSFIERSCGCRRAAIRGAYVSIDATMKSNVAVGPPIDLLCYETDSLLANSRMRLDQDDPYLQEIGRKWQNGIIKLVKEMPAPDFTKPSLGFATAA